MSKKNSTEQLLQELEGEASPLDITKNKKESNKNQSQVEPNPEAVDGSDNKNEKNKPLKGGLDVLDKIDTSSLPPGPEEEPETENQNNPNKEKDDPEKADSNENKESKENIFNNGVEKQRVTPDDIKKLRKELENKNDKESKDFLRVLNKHTEELNDLIENKGNKKEISRNMGIVKALYNGYVNGQMDTDKIIDTDTQNVEKEKEEKEPKKQQQQKQKNPEKEKSVSPIGRVAILMLEKEIDDLESNESPNSNNDRVEKIRKAIEKIKTGGYPSKTEMNKLDINLSEIYNKQTTEVNKRTKYLEDKLEDLNIELKESIDSGKIEFENKLKEEIKETEEELSRLEKQRDSYKNMKSDSFDVDGLKLKNKSEKTSEEEKEEAERLERYEDMLKTNNENDSEQEVATEGSPETSKEGANPETERSPETKDEIEKQKQEILRKTPEEIARSAQDMEQGYNGPDSLPDADLDDSKKNLKKAFEDILGIELNNGEVEMLDESIENENEKKKLSEGYQKLETVEKEVSSPLSGSIRSARIERQNILDNKNKSDKINDFWTGNGFMVTSILSMLGHQKSSERLDARKELRKDSRKWYESPKRYAKRREKEINKKITSLSDSIDDSYDIALSKLENRADLTDAEKLAKKSVLENLKEDSKDTLRYKYKQDFEAIKYLKEKSSILHFGRLFTGTPRLYSGKIEGIRAAEGYLGSKTSMLEATDKYYDRMAKRQLREVEATTTLEDFTRAMAEVAGKDNVTTEATEKILDDATSNPESQKALRKVFGYKKIDSYDHVSDFYKHELALKKLKEQNPDLYKVLAGSNILGYLLQEKNKKLDNPKFTSEKIPEKKNTRKEKMGIITPRVLLAIGTAASIWWAASRNMNEKGSADAGREYIDSRPDVKIEQVQNFEPTLIEGIESIPVFIDNESMEINEKDLSNYYKIINGQSLDNGVDIKKAQLSRALEMARKKGIEINSNDEVSVLANTVFPMPLGVVINDTEIPFDVPDYNEREMALWEFIAVQNSQEQAKDAEGKTEKYEPPVETETNLTEGDNELREFYYEMLNSDDYEKILRDNPDKVMEAKRARAIEIAEMQGYELTEEEKEKAEVIGIYYSAVPFGLSTPDRNIEFDISRLPDIDKVQYYKDYKKAVEKARKTLNELGY